MKAIVSLLIAMAFAIVCLLPSCGPTPKVDTPTDTSTDIEVVSDGEVGE